MPEVELPKPDELHEQAENRFSRRVALVTAVFAVVLAIAALGGNHAMKEMLLSQQQSSDQWSFYQAKVIREHLYRGQKLRLEADLAEREGTIRPAAREKLETLLRRLDEEEQRYAAEKRDIEKSAKSSSTSATSSPPATPTSYSRRRCCRSPSSCRRCRSSPGPG